MDREKVKLRAGKYMIPCTLIFDNNYIYFDFKYNKILMLEIKMMEGAHWCGYDKKPVKIWRIKDTPGNRFRLDYLRGNNPYANYDSPLVELEFERPLYQHQIEAVRFIYTHKRIVYAGIMNAGKTLTAIEVMERSGFDDWWYVSSKGALKETVNELKKWNCLVSPELMTYTGLTSRIKNWTDGDISPRGIIFDESSKIKNTTTQRSQAALALADGMRRDHEDPFIILLTGTPAPREPVNWWHQCHVACPGFLKEGSANQLKQTLALTQTQEGLYGGVYNQVVTWKDNELKCAVCGKFEDEHDEYSDHAWQKSINEVARLHKRMKGLVLIHLDEDCPQLPEFIFRKINLQPSSKTIQMAKAIMANTSGGAKTLLQLRMLSDGFRYTKEPTGEEICPACKDGKIIFEGNEHICDVCGGTGFKKTYTRGMIEFESPKEEALRDCLDELEDVGRIVIYGGFQGSIDKIIKIVQGAGWDYVKADGRGWTSNLEGEPLNIFTKQLIKYEKVAFIGQPGAAGMGLNLQVSPMIVYYSNVFDFESRKQSMHRCRRHGMDIKRGCTIVDLIHLPTDQLVLDNLEKKNWLQKLTMGDIEQCMLNQR
ncbi:MAG: hypothetical protein ACFFG0_09245 [Candidatus Thorarchaeota archaeon]